MKKRISITEKTLKRLSHYHFYLRKLLKNKRDFVSNQRLAFDLNLSTAEVREDLENLNVSLSISDIHSVEHLLTVVEQYLGYDQVNSAAIVGVGNLGKAILNYPGFQEYGLEIIALFDRDPLLVGTKINGQKVVSVDKMANLVKRMNIQIGIITCPPQAAQNVCNTLVEAGVRGIWNFSQELLKVPNEVELRNTSLYSDYLQLLDKLRSTSL